MAGENFREGRVEVTFELWAEQDMLSRFQRRFQPLSGEAISEESKFVLFPHRAECRIFYSIFSKF